ncbi:hypothetical protein KJ903_03490 [Patescibacteria group bacterium]|nr:hypothetical protein [Patescibacteria group bacterium]
MKKYICLILVWLIVTSLTGCSFNQNQPSDQVAVDYSDGEVAVSVKEIKTDKQIYHSQEDLTISLALESSGEGKNLLLAIAGLESSNGDNYIDKREKIKIPFTESFTNTFSLPECSTCSGFPEGDYDIKATVYQGNEVLAEEKTFFTLQP